MSDEPNKLNDDSIAKLLSELHMLGKIYLHHADEAFMKGDKVRAQAYAEFSQNIETLWRIVADDEDFGPVEPEEND